MKGLIANRFVLFGLVVLALAVLFAVAWVSRPAAGSERTGARRSQVVPLTSAIRSCPAPGSGRIAVFAVPGPSPGSSPSTSRGPSPGQDRAKLVAVPSLGISATASAATGSGATAAPPTALLSTLSQPGRLWLSKNGFAAGRAPRATLQTPRALGEAVIVDATGPMAQGLDAEQTTYPPNGSAAAVSGVQCAQPGTDFWFLGPGPAKAAAVELYLLNPDSEPAAVDVEIFTDTGPLQDNTDTGIEVPSRGSVVQSVGKLVRGSQVVALHVRTSVGRVAAAVQTWWRAASAPAAQVVIPGLPGEGTGRRLYLIDPGGNDAQVHVQAITPAGTYEPAGAGGIDVPASSVVALDLPSLNGIPAALRLQSAAPVTAAVLAAGHAYTAATGPVEQQGVVADNATGAGYATSVVLSAPDGAARVRVTTAAAGGLLGAGQLVSVAAGHSANVSVTVPRGVQKGFAIVISPLAGSGPVYAGRVLEAQAGGIQLITSVVSRPSSVTLPPISGSAAAAIQSEPAGLAARVPGVCHTGIMRKFSLDALAREHVARAETASSGRSAETVYGGHECVLRQTLLAMIAGASLTEHDNPDEATLLVLRGRVRMAAGNDSWEGREGDLLIVPEARHNLVALENAVVILTVAKVQAPGG